MPGGKFDSSKTRVRPVFDALWKGGRDWLPQLLALPAGGCPGGAVVAGDLALVDGHWEPKEKCLKPPVSLLSWLIRNIRLRDGMSFENDLRQPLAEGDPGTIAESLHLLRTVDSSRGWYVFEGPTCPDVYLVARDAPVVVEGKRTESATTTDTTWLGGRHQIWRHLDAAWEVRGRRAVCGLFIVEGDATTMDGSVPEHWRTAAEQCLAPDALRTSFPHRSADEAAAISRCYLGITTRRQVCERFHIDWRGLPHDTSGLGA
jgi:hypothetical protein